MNTSFSLIFCHKALENSVVWVERRLEKWMYSGWADISEKLLISVQLFQMHFYLEHFYSLKSSIIFLSSLFLLNFSLFFHSLPSIITAAPAQQWLSIEFIRALLLSSSHCEGWLDDHPADTGLLRRNDQTHLILCSHLSIVCRSQRCWHTVFT